MKTPISPGAVSGFELNRLGAFPGRKSAGNADELFRSTDGHAEADQRTLGDLSRAYLY